MTIAFWCVLAAAVLPLAWAGVAKSRRSYDNRAPRDYLAGLEGWRKRADWAQQNAWESFAPFAAAVCVARLAGASQPTADILAVVFITARVAHGLLYLADRPALRSVAWLVGFACVVGLFLAGWR
ncbi:MAG: MAPEG family protein [Betaproteobacteria bacterium]|jgi:uncharacterized MAPEG superfamily protein